jgi:predicted SPOUT superfamily RNA methylase MTH1
MTRRFQTGNTRLGIRSCGDRYSSTMFGVVCCRAACQFERAVCTTPCQRVVVEIADLFCWKINRLAPLESPLFTGYKVQQCDECLVGSVQSYVRRSKGRIQTMTSDSLCALDASPACINFSNNRHKTRPASHQPRLTNTSRRNNYRAVGLIRAH